MLMVAIVAWQGLRIQGIAQERSADDRLLRDTVSQLLSVDPAAHPAARLTPDAARKEAEAAVQHVLGRAEVRRLEAQANLRSGTAFTMALLFVLALLVAEPTARAVARQHQQLKAQARELTRLMLVARSTSNPMVVTDGQGLIEWFNEAFAQRCGCDPDSLLHLALDKVLGEGGTDQNTLVQLSHALGSGQGLQCEMRRDLPEGKVRCIRLDLQPVLGSTGKPTAFVAVLSDITELVAQRQQNDALLAALPNGVVMRSASGKMLSCNPAAAQQLQLTEAQAIGDEPLPEGWKTVFEDLRFMPPDERPAPKALLTGRSVTGMVMGTVSPEGNVRWLLCNAEPVRDALGRTSGAVSCFTDITHQRSEQAGVAHMIDAVGLGTWQWDMRNGDMVFNDRLLTMLGYRPGDVAPHTRDWGRLVHPDDRRTWQAALRTHLVDPSMPCRAEIRVRRPDGDWATILSCGVVVEREGSGAPRRMAGVNIDMTEQTQMQVMLRHTARTDGLTQLPNRAAVFEQVQQAVDRAAREPGFEWAVLFMDFDRFKQINDTLGPRAGDDLLRQIAQRLRGALRADDVIGRRASHDLQGSVMDGITSTAGRIGGDEFVVVLEGLHGSDEACAVAARLMEVLAVPYRIGRQVVHSSASIGIVTSDRAANDANAVMRDADTAMYEAKRNGRSRFVVFDPSMHERVVSSVTTEADLRLALARQELFVAYQPVVELQQQGPGGVEALVRWRHPQRGLISPIEFISVAEESGLIVELGRFVMETACHQFVAWQRALGPLAPVSMAVNLSPVQLRMPELVTDIRRTLADTGIAPAALQLEVTESLAAQDEVARARLREIKALGVRIALDDFGTGYSSLACLHLLPVDTVKIDRSFVMHAETSDYHRVLIEATLRVAETLGMSTVAEGIETASQAELMRRLKCGRGQGFLWSRPQEADALTMWLIQRSDALQAAA
jgi:PAS domain S-box-containing protein